MQRKIFLNKDSKSGTYSYPRLLLWAALGLMVLVLLTPLLMHKSTHNNATHSPPAQKGALVGKVPKTPSQETTNQAMELAGMNPAQSAANPGTGTGTTESQVQPNGPNGVSASTTAAPVSSASQGAGPSLGSQTVASSQPPSTTSTPTVSGSSGSQGAGEGLANQTTPSPATTSESTQPGELESSTATTAALPSASTGKSASAEASGAVQPSPAKVVPKGHPATLRKPALAKSAPTSHGEWEYIVRVGSFRHMKNAEDIQKALQKKGYDVVIKPYRHPTLGLLHLVQLPPVYNASKARTLLAALKKLTKDQAMLIKVRAGE